MNARSVKGVLAVIAAMIGAVCVARVATAEQAPTFALADFEGRWVSEKRQLTLDISRCGADVCGVLVADNVCGHTALRVNDRPPPKGEFIGRVRPGELFGQLKLANNTQPYGVRAVLSRDASGTPSLTIAGHSGGAYSMIRRMYDYNALLARAGDARCASSPKMS